MISAQLILDLLIAPNSFQSLILCNKKTIQSLEMPKERRVDEDAIGERGRERELERERGYVKTELYT